MRVRGGRAVAMLDHPRPTKAVLSFVNREAGIRIGMLGVAHICWLMDVGGVPGVGRMADE